MASLVTCQDKEDMGKQVAQVIKKCCQSAVDARGSFSIAFSGGSLPAIVAMGLVDQKAADFQFDKWKIFFSDERCVPTDHDDSNYLECHKKLFSKVGITEEQCLTIDNDLIDSPTEAAKAYQAGLIEWLSPDDGDSNDNNNNNDDDNELAIDLVLLGMGPDGHTCSLFPGHQLLDESKLMIASITDSPKPPSNRITFTLPLLAQARQIAFVCAGASKAEALVEATAFASTSKLPVALVQSCNHNTVWFVDTAAAAKL